MQERLATAVQAKYPPLVSGAYPVPFALVRLAGSIAAPVTNDTVLIPRNLDLAELTLGDLTAQQRQNLRNFLETWIEYQFVDWDGAIRRMPGLAAMVATYTTGTLVRAMLRDIYRYLGHSTDRPRPGLFESHNTEYLDSFATDPTSRWTAELGSATWDSGNSEYPLNGAGDNLLRYSANGPGSIEHEAQATFLVNTAAGDPGGSACRFDTAGANDAYAAQVWDWNNQNQLRLYRWNAGVRSNLADLSTLTVADNDWVTLRTACAGAAGANVVINLWAQNHGTTKPSDPGWYGVDATPGYTYTDTAVDRLDDTNHGHCGMMSRNANTYDIRHSFFKLRAISDRGGGGTTYFSTVAGTMTTAGGLLKHSATAKAGTLTSAGALLKQTAKAFTGTVATAGTLAAIKTVLLSLAGTLTTAGALVKQTGKPLASALTTAGALVKQARKAFTGTLTSAGVLTSIKTILKDLGTATLSTAGAVVRQTRTSVSGTMTTAGALVKQARKAFTGTLTTAGTLAAIRTVLLALTAVLSTAGALTKRTSTSLTGTLATAGAVVKRTARALVGALTTVGALAATLGIPADLVRTILVKLHIRREVPRNLSVHPTIDIRK